MKARIIERTYPDSEKGCDDLYEKSYYNSTKKPSTYKIVAAINHKELEIEVNKEIANGMVPFGGVVITTLGHKYCNFLQPMLSRKE